MVRHRHVARRTHEFLPFSVSPGVARYAAGPNRRFVPAVRLDLRPGFAHSVVACRGQLSTGPLGNASSAGHHEARIGSIDTGGPRAGVAGPDPLGGDSDVAPGPHVDCPFRFAGRYVGGGLSLFGSDCVYAVRLSPEQPAVVRVTSSAMEPLDVSALAPRPVQRATIPLSSPALAQASSAGTETATTWTVAAPSPLPPRESDPFQERVRWLSQVDRLLREVLPRPNHPLFLAGSDEACSLFRSLHPDASTTSTTPRCWLMRRDGRAQPIGWTVGARP